VLKRVPLPCIALARIVLQKTDVDSLRTGTAAPITMSDTIPTMDVQVIATELGEAELIDAAKDEAVIATQEKMNLLIAKANKEPNALAIIGIIKTLLPSSTDDLAVGDEARQLAVRALKWLASQLKTPAGREKLTSATEFMDDLAKADSTLWPLLVSGAGALEPVLAEFKQKWSAELAYDTKQDYIREAIAKYTMRLIQAFKIPPVSLPAVEVPKNGTLRLIDVQITNVTCEIAPPNVSGNQLATAVPRIDYRPQTKFALTVSNLSFEATATVERRNTPILSDWTGKVKMTAQKCSVRLLPKQHPWSFSILCVPHALCSLALLPRSILLSFSLALRAADELEHRAVGRRWQDHSAQHKARQPAGFHVADREGWGLHLLGRRRNGRLLEDQAHRHWHGGTIQGPADHPQRSAFAPRHGDQRHHAEAVRRSGERAGRTAVAITSWLIGRRHGLFQQARSRG
jgi:hypothetical protein